MKRSSWRIVTCIWLKYTLPDWDIVQVPDIGINIFQIVTAPERSVPDGSDGIGDRQGLQAPAVIERQFADKSDRVGDNHTQQIITAMKRPVLDGGNGVRNAHARKTIATWEREVADDGDRVRDNSIQAASYQCIGCRLDDSITIVAGVVIWITIFYRYARYWSTTPKRIYADRGDSARDGHTRQTATPAERSVANGGDRPRDSHILQADTVSVSVTYCISINLDWNGRKVMAEILWNTKNVKI